MKNNSIFWTLVYVIVLSCNNNAGDNNTSNKSASNKKSVSSKPSSNYQDTLQIDFTAAVFYHPDSMQLQKIKGLIDSAVFDATMHEYFYQMRNARIVLTKNWPRIKIIEANNIRFLLFKKKNNEQKIIDLDTKGDPHGLFLFDQEQDPEQADMMNIDTELPRYFFKK